MFIVLFLNLIHFLADCTEAWNDDESGVRKRTLLLDSIRVEGAETGDNDEVGACNEDSGWGVEDTFSLLQIVPFLM